MTFFHFLNGQKSRYRRATYVGVYKHAEKLNLRFVAFLKKQKKKTKTIFKMQFRYFVAPLAGSAFYHMTLFPLSDWLDDQVSALWDAGVCKKVEKPKNPICKKCRFGILLRDRRYASTMEN